MDVHAKVLVWRTSLLLRRAARDRHRLLVRELADYRSEAELDDLYAALDRCPEHRAREVRRLLAAQRGRELVTH